MGDPTDQRARQYRFGPFELDVRAGELRKRGVRLRLREQVLQLLLLLLEHPGEIVLRDEIRFRLWPNETVVEFDNGINSAIRRLRDVLGESAEKPRYVETVARRGYRFMAEVETVYDSPIEPLTPNADLLDVGNLVGKLVSHYQVLSELGSGGMGVVFRAKDLNLDRDVALKFLPEECSRHPQLLERFQREARAAAALNHPGICTIYEIGEQQRQPFIAMELLEGQTLKDRLIGSPLPAGAMVSLAVQIAEALQAAHAGGIIHRDIKPANLFVTQHGRAKILDFGLAKLLPERATSEGAALAGPADGANPASPVGTMAYMSPEQIRGEALDHRSDIFSLGVVLYEMLAGKKAFGGSSSNEVMHSILTDNPPRLRSTAPAGLDQIVRRCLEKEPARRFRSAADLRLALSSLPEPAVSTPTTWKPAAPVAPPAARSRLYVALASVSLALLAVILLYFRQKPPEVRPIRFSIAPPADIGYGDLNDGPALISPDGSLLAFVSDQLWIRPLDAPVARPLAGTSGAKLPFWSPDSRYLAFFADRKLKKIPVGGGPTQTLCDAPNGRGGSWARALDGGPGNIVFAPDGPGALWRVSAEGGAAVPVTALDSSRQISHRQPEFLPDGRHFLYLVINIQSMPDGIFIGDIQAKPDPKNARRLMGGAARVSYAPPGYLLFVQDNNLVARAFDTKRLEFSGEPLVLAEHVAAGRMRHTSDFSVSANGVLAWHSRSSALHQLAWFDRSGKQLQGLDAQDEYNDEPRLSPDDNRIALPIMNDLQPGARNIWLLDLVHGAKLQLSHMEGGSVCPVWSPDGRKVVFGLGWKAPDYGLYWQDANGSGDAAQLLKTVEFSIPADWSRDGRFILFTQGVGRKRSIWLLPLSGDRKPAPLVQTELTEAHGGAFSPDGHWIAYVSNESGRNEIYVRSFTEGGAGVAAGKWPVSTAGGYDPRWRSDGKELFFITYGKVWAVPVKPGTTFTAGIPVGLFDVPGAFLLDASPDGHRFLITRMLPEGRAGVVNICLNWLAGMKR